ncbi:hypothetical protein BDW71DRAFT_186370 [Aspergillus fruticulosus]
MLNERLNAPVVEGSQNGRAWAVVDWSRAEKLGGVLNCNRVANEGGPDFSDACACARSSAKLQPLFARSGHGEKNMEIGDRLKGKVIVLFAFESGTVISALLLLLVLLLLLLL